ncbi:MAG: bifunctional diaminohydroxyphosphoribosylaminopyrimidine deaminase/5-amino-6-(5-phosphoribosylamino)uracil reductase RibD [Bacteroidota bacterium]|nr:bifunctional diaminohydroxyphosphoribosylaminopyrimidine deaminase/5-amino-6-(5-phosphoribosylamino)uracil reductase RibD [Bacteroidota bacterium]
MDSIIVDRDEAYMRRCLHLAGLSLGSTHTNPLVGSVIVYNDSIIGEGRHEKYGEFHAERNAINSVENKDLLPNSTLYVNLEPCNHYGKTPPCSDFIINSGIRQVVVGMLDCNPIVSGCGIEKLISAGILVKVGVLKQNCEVLNRRFIINQKKNRPYIILKWASSSDGYIAPVEPSHYWLTNATSRQWVHKWRTEEDAIWVGYQTARLDNPLLTVRDVAGRNPTRIVYDPKLELESSLSIYNNDANTIVINNSKEEIVNNIRYLNWDGEDYMQLFSRLLQLNIGSIIIEGGAKTLYNFIARSFYDEIRHIKK